MHLYIISSFAILRWFSWDQNILSRAYLRMFPGKSSSYSSVICFHPVRSESSPAHIQFCFWIRLEKDRMPRIVQSSAWRMLLWTRVECGGLVMWKCIHGTRLNVCNWIWNGFSSVPSWGTTGIWEYKCELVIQTSGLQWRVKLGIGYQCKIACLV